MVLLGTSIQMLLDWLPTGARAAVMGLFAIFLIFLALRVVKLVLDALPFL